MSYSISARAATISMALAALATKFDEEVLPQQPIHAEDRTTALAAAHAVVSKAAEPAPGHEIVISMHGSIYKPTAGQYSIANLSVGASFQYYDPIAQRTL